MKSLQQNLLLLANVSAIPSDLLASGIKNEDRISVLTPCGPRMVSVSMSRNEDDTVSITQIKLTEQRGEYGAYRPFYPPENFFPSFAAAEAAGYGIVLMAYRVADAVAG